MDDRQTGSWVTLRVGGVTGNLANRAIQKYGPDLANFRRSAMSSNLKNL